MSDKQIYRIFISISWGFSIAVAGTRSLGFEQAMITGILVSLLVYAIQALIDSFNLPEDFDFLLNVFIGYLGISVMLLMAIILLINLVFAALGV